jgi:hypothetical protein
MNQPPGNGRPPHGYPPGYPQQTPPGYGQQSQSGGQGQQQQPQQYGQPQGYGQPLPRTQLSYGQPSHDPQAFAETAYAGSSFSQEAQRFVQQYQSQANAPGYGPPQPYAPQQGYAPQPQGMMNAAFAVPSARRGMPSIMCFVFGLLAVVVALGFDVLFLKVNVPVADDYVWYLTTALSFAGAGYASALWTRAGRGLVTGVVTTTAFVYGAADVGLALVLDDVGLVRAASLAAIGVVIAIGTGMAGAYRGWRARDD